MRAAMKGNLGTKSYSATGATLLFTRIVMGYHRYLQDLGFVALADTFWAITTMLCHLRRLRLLLRLLLPPLPPPLPPRPPHPLLLPRRRRDASCVQSVEVQ